MHAYSAIPDIKADSEAGISTVATLLWKQYTLIFCWFLYFMAAYLSFAFLWRPVVLFGWLYCFIMFRSYQLKSLVTLYKYFPTINLLVGMFITFIVIYKNYIN
jgi:4-hydroxybenzoate polyprenyltransferase